MPCALMFARVGTMARPALRRRFRSAFMTAWLTPESEMIWPLLPSPYIHGDTSSTSFRLASTASVPGPMFQ